LGWYFSQAEEKTIIPAASNDLFMGNPLLDLGFFFHWLRQASCHEKNACYYARASRATRRFKHFRLASLRVCHTDARLQ
jgi:hypothetical protein